MQTSNSASAVDMPTLDDMLKAFDEALAVPEPIGELHGAVVYLHHDTRELSFGEMRVSVDHVYLVGTAIRDEALRRLGETP